MGKIAFATNLICIKVSRSRAPLQLATRLRAAIEAAPYRHPKLAVTGHPHFEGKDFASQLERAIARSRSETPAMLSAPKIVEHDAVELKTPNQRYRRY